MIRARWSVAIGVAALSSLALACSGSSSGERAGATVEDDAIVLQTILGTDPARTILHDVDEAIRAERPVMAAELIQQAALPAVRRHIEEFQHARVATQEGRRLRDRAIRLHRARRDALERYANALARGIGTEDEELLAGLDAYGDAEREILRLHDDLDAIRPISPEAIERAREARETTLGGLPPIRRGEPPEADDAPGELPGPGPDDSAGEPAEPLPETDDPAE